MAEILIQKFPFGCPSLATVRGQKMRLRISPSFHLPQNIHSISCVATHCSNQGKFRKQFSNPHDTHLFINLLVISPKECTRVLIQQPDMCGTSNITVVEMRDGWRRWSSDSRVSDRLYYSKLVRVCQCHGSSSRHKVPTPERLSWRPRILMICGYLLFFFSTAKAGAYGMGKEGEEEAWKPCGTVRLNQIPSQLETTRGQSWHETSGTGGSRLQLASNTHADFFLA